MLENYQPRNGSGFQTNATTNFASRDPSIVPENTQQLSQLSNTSKMTKMTFSANLS